MKILQSNIRRFIKKIILESQITNDSRDKLMSLLQSQYGISFMKTTEEFGINPGGIWLSAEDRDPMPNSAELIFDYYSEDYQRYDVGVNIDFENWLRSNGWYPEWYDVGTIMLWPIK